VQPLSLLPPETARAARGLFFDIDDTLTTHGKLTASAYSALWRAHDAGLLCMAITGRPAGWCDHFARMWPLAGVIGENGALYFCMREGRLFRRYRYDEETRRENRRKLEAIRDEVLRRFPTAAVASDQPYREFDLAIDFCEDVPPLSLDEVDEIVAIFRSHGATAKVSSIHVNGWYGEYDKLSMCHTFLAEQHEIDLDQERARFFYVGDFGARHLQRPRSSQLKQVLQRPPEVDRPRLVPSSRTASRPSGPAGAKRPAGRKRC
jgi:hypothetical protein